MVHRFLFAVCVFGLLAGAAAAAPPDHDPAAPTRRAWTLTDVVLDKQLDPCTRQEMLLGGAAALFKAAGVEPAPTPTPHTFVRGAGPGESEPRGVRSVRAA